MLPTGAINLALVLLTGTVAFASGASFDKDLNLIHLEDDLKTWVPPEEFRTNFTYYLSGYDDDGSPMWITEWGRWDIRKFIDQGGDVVVDLEKFIDKVIFDVIGSLNLTKSPDGSFSGVKAIIDLEGYGYSQLRSFPTLQFYFKKFSYLAPRIDKFLKKVYAVNANYIAQTGINMLRPILGSIMEKIEIYGPNKSKWIQRLRQEVPEEILPEWYGGSKDFKPLKVYG